jgi:hypothetical protein
MTPVRRIVPLVLTGAVLAGCGSSITDVTPRSTAPTQARAVSPFCDAVERSQTAAEPVSRGRIGARVENIDDVADQVRSANQQVSALAPPELRADADRVTGVVDRQLRLLVDSDGDTLVLSRDPELSRATSDPEYAAASRRLGDYVRSTC